MLGQFASSLLSLARNDKGASSVEYGVLLALIIAICVIAITTFGLMVWQGYDGFNSSWNALEENSLH